MGDCSGRIVGYSISDRMKSRLAVNAFSSAVARRGGAHRPAASRTPTAGRGPQLRSRTFLAEPRRRTTRQQLRRTIMTWIERAHHRRRRRARLSMLTPIESEAINAPEVALAA